jgi:hypothetical protein
MLDRALEAVGTSLDRLPPKQLDGYLHEHRYPRLEALLADIALGTRMPAQVARVLVREADDTPDLLDPARMAGEGWFNPAIVQRRWRDHLSGRRHSTPALWAVLMFQSWLREQRQPMSAAA